VLNLIALLDNRYEVDGAERIKKELKDITSSHTAKDHIRELAKSYGYVRTPESFEEAGMNWARSGQLDLAAASLTRGEKLLPDVQKDRLKAAVASISLSMDRVDLGRNMYEELLKIDPRNHQALVGLVRIAIGAGDFSRAGKLLTAAELAGAEKSQIELETASLEMSAGNRDKARGILQQLVERNPNLLRAWNMLAEILALDDDTVALDKCFRQMAKLDGGRPFVAVVKAKIAMRKGDQKGARRSFEDALLLLPNNFYVLEQLLRLDLMDGEAESLLLHAKNLLRMNPGHAFANYAVGYLHAVKGEKDLAEDSFRRSIESGRSPEALNDLAWLLQQRGEFVEAEKLTREALATGAGIPAVWDTLGVILTKTAKSDSARLDEAELALNHALAASKDALFSVLHMASLQAAKGEKAKAIALLKTLSSSRDRLSQANQKEMDRLAASLDFK